MRIVRLTEETRKDLLNNLLKRSPSNYSEYEGTVSQIVADVREKGDEALFSYTEKFDHMKLTKENITVTEEEIREAYELVDPKLVDVIRKALVNIRTFHEKQRRSSWFLSVFRPDEYRTGEGCRRSADYYDHASGQGRKDQSQYPGCRA